MKTVLFLLLTASLAWSQEEPPVEQKPARTLQEIWKMTEQEYLRVHPSRRRDGEMFKYHRARARGPHGNLLERVPGGPVRPARV